MTTKVLVVEDQKLPREYLERLVQESEGYELVGSLTAADLAVTACAQRKIDLILMDVCTSGLKTGLEATAEVKQAFPRVKVIIVTSMVEVGYLEQARRAHADSFWYKDTSDEELFSVIERTMAGESVFPEKTPAVQIGMASSDDFTPGEIRVLRLVCNGFSYDEIAEQLGVTPNAVKYHVSNILAKTGFSNKISLAVNVISQNFIIPTDSGH